MSDNNLSLKQGSGNTVTFKTIKNSISRDASGNITSSAGNIRFVGGNDTISTQGGDIIFDNISSQPSQSGGENVKNVSISFF